MSQQMPAKAASPQRPRGSFGQTAPRPRRKMSTTKSAVLSPEARKAIEDRNNRLIQEAIDGGRVTQCPTRWALGSSLTGTFFTNDQ